MIPVWVQKQKQYFNVYIATNDVEAALKAAGLDDDHYYMIAADYPFEATQNLQLIFLPKFCTIW